jgi:uncharacterized repeat protein (TIGR03847 family)
MPRIIYRHQPATRFVVSAIGEPGSREFFLQVRSAENLNTVSIDKGQVIALTERLNELIRELRRGKLATPEDLAASLVQDDAPLELPIEPDFAVGVISITWENEYIIINIQAATQNDDRLIDDIDYGPDLIVASLKINQIKGFCNRASLVVNAGRPACPFCALPVDPQGHLCPRSNGYRR